MGAKESHINNSKDIEVRVALPTNTAHKTIQLSKYKMHIIRIFSMHYSLLLEDCVHFFTTVLFRGFFYLHIIIIFTTIIFCAWRFSGLY